VIERIQAQMAEDPGQSLRKLASIECKRANNASNCRGRSSIQINGSYDPFGPKLALRQYRYVLVQGILAS